jgi:septal ring factor EnvC (AmiA/AmiB activator)
MGWPGLCSRDRAVQPAAHADAPGGLSREQVRALEEELSYTKDHLQAAVQEHETANEELQATNEELIAANEELQSTNEELHSVNPFHDDASRRRRRRSRRARRAPPPRVRRLLPDGTSCDPELDRISSARPMAAVEPGHARGITSSARPVR